MADEIRCILLVDDDPDANHLHKFVIQQTFPVEQVHLAENGTDALQFLVSEPVDRLRPDLVFLDINMPGMDGWAFLDAMDQLPADKREGISVVMLTTSSDPTDRERALAHDQVCLYLTKPLTEDAFDELIQQQLTQMAAES